MLVHASRQRTVGFSCVPVFKVSLVRNSVVMAVEAKDERRRVPVGTKLEDRWQVTKILGEGAFGAVYEVVDADRPGKVFALKVESNADDPEGPPKMLPLEVTVLRALRNIGAKYYPGYESCGQNDKFNYVVMGLVGKNIDSLRKTLPNKRFALRSCLH
uniref:Protein kinase domain-containing protein n=1 Tax=Romanomermis culicivorax TaxID=13658 RepID=A0A915L2K8_ROMCU